MRSLTAAVEVSVIRCGWLFERRRAGGRFDDTGGGGCLAESDGLGTLRRKRNRPIIGRPEEVPHPASLQGGAMNHDCSFDRRSFLVAGASLVAAAAMPDALAQSRTKPRFSCAFTEQDLRAEAYKNFGAAMKDSFDFEPYWNNTLFKQGTELVALQRGNIEMVNLAPQDISKQLPAWSLMTSAYLFRDPDHLKKTFKSDVGREFVKVARDKLDIQIITPVYFGARHVNLKPDKTIRTPQDLAGIKLRMPPGEFWQFLGESIGVSPTPVA